MLWRNCTLHVHSRFLGPSHHSVCCLRTISLIIFLWLFIPDCLFKVTFSQIIYMSGFLFIIVIMFFIYRRLIPGLSSCLFSFGCPQSPSETRRKTYDLSFVKTLRKMLLISYQLFPGHSLTVVFISSSRAQAFQAKSSA